MSFNVIVIQFRCPMVRIRCNYSCKSYISVSITGTEENNINLTSHKFWGFDFATYFLKHLFLHVIPKGFFRAWISWSMSSSAPATQITARFDSQLQCSTDNHKSIQVPEHRCSCPWTSRIYSWMMDATMYLEVNLHHFRSAVESNWIESFLPERQSGLRLLG